MENNAINFFISVCENGYVVLATYSDGFTDQWIAKTPRGISDIIKKLTDQNTKIDKKD